ncbi:MAG: hypothetical protein UU73_C0001G0311 [Candidatus Daviesbacteria bacterium GW2011_GWA1_41_61]|uniref:Uncharacterized protein n=1 Tax=Candidatus Daviesbacteria bacterium GW2011_GWA2_40_9 TaxID=1618424 RepID=A0A0G0U8I1_9BACT|nr:MAG: hypothetical protein UU26_C0029G0021 [Candidatus Daviesbacteria bacterium GW2011_GWC1_40_9]KKR83561.1 MAG: hypothetical protein UU29_C0004G0062 [Candidatus Daviesbacteria bacterium GW2011_GWA2_40_9]KKR93130.1 MAG: hypothetical protein UU44_C0004G0312 [Candidatus Daviesbacteria bacterium GW2011_GWB1_41_15]KKS15674.1 MAG: hypothetical protein UU73_C0001G0311 [Candidatus Daviesbacteria bacterium GW2011_GWA1_41_61]
MKFYSKNPQYEHLRKKWLAKHKALSDKLLVDNSSSLRRAAIGGLGGMVLLTTPAAAIFPGVADSLASFPQGSSINKAEDKNKLLAEALKDQVPGEVGKLTPQEEEKIRQTVSQKLDIRVAAEIEGIRLNRSYGLIGGEQHLYRYPGDDLFKHADNASDWAMYGPAGMAPGLGAWGYFAPSQAAFTAKDKERERYYLAVQTFLAPGFAENVGKFRDFFKFRKMVVVNPQSGQAVVAVVGDAGPAEWTGKHLGGSPEVMHFLGLAKGPRKGPVLYFFVDDPQDEVPLGPISIKEGKN